jgi:multisubunit Na+/H+ antiporter MnhB subunit
MVNEVVIVLLAISAGVAGGVVTPVMAWLASDEPFNPRKFVQGLLTCVIAGLTFSVFGLYSPPSDGPIALAIYWLEIFLATCGVDYFRNKIGGSVRAGQGGAQG